MKLRIEKETVCLRLSDGEVQDFASTGRVAATVHFGINADQQFTYALERGSERPQSMGDEEPVQVHYEPGALTVLVPFTLAKTWVETGQVGVSHELPLAENQRLRILVEKDLGTSH
jgi:hypothetical protein